MHEINITEVLAVLAIILTAAKLAGAIAKQIGQPAVLGEMIAGVVLGGSVLHVVDPSAEYIHVLAELGVIILLFEIGMETDLKKLLQVGGESVATAAVGVVAPFVLGYLVCWMLGIEGLVAVVVAASHAPLRWPFRRHQLLQPEAGLVPLATSGRAPSEVATPRQAGGSVSSCSSCSRRR